MLLFHLSLAAPAVNPGVQTTRLLECSEFPSTCLQAEAEVSEPIVDSVAITELFEVEDYKEMYPDDPYGAEAGQNARVWRVYLDETEQFDNDMIQGFRDTLDVHLVFVRTSNMHRPSELLLTMPRPRSSPLS